MEGLLFYIPFVVGTYTSGGVGQPEVLGIAAGDETTPLTVGTNKVTFRLPYKMTITGVRATLTTAQTVGDQLTIDINANGASILSTRITIDNTEKTSVTATTPPVIASPNQADDVEITVDVDQVGSSADAAGLKIWIIGTRG